MNASQAPAHGVRPGKSLLTALLALVAIFALIGLNVATVSAVPAGNNGTVKVDGIDFDQHVDNEPHVGCVFRVNWFNFDASVTSHVTFEVHPPSGAFETILEDDVLLLNNEPAGAPADYSGSEEYDLSPYLTSYYEHPNQGFHVKLTINTPDSNGEDVKHKVFWVSSCGEAKPTPEGSQGGGTGTPAASSTPEGSQAGGTGTPEASVVDSATSRPGVAGPLATIGFGLALLASLGTLAYANVRSVRNRG